jgi:DNA-binding IclR family transcriptional regulator
MRDADITRIALRINAEAKDDRDRVSISDLLHNIEIVRKQGYALTTNLVTLGGGMLAMAMPGPGDGESPLVIGLGGISEVLRIHEANFASILRSEIDKYNKTTFNRREPRSPIAQ